MIIKHMWLFTIFILTTTALAKQTDSLHHGYIYNENVQLHYVTAGKGPLIVLLHGFPDFWYTWRQLIPVLAKHYQVVALDLRGYNKSDKPKGIDAYKMSVLLSDVVQTIKHFSQSKATLIGHDWGGAIAWQMAIWYPQYVDDLVILSTPHPIGLVREVSHNKNQQSKSQYAFNFLEKDAHKKITMDYLTSWIKDSTEIPIYEEAFVQSDVESMLNYYKANFPRKASNILQGSVTPKLIKARTLALFGKNDQAFSSAAWNESWTYIKNDFTLISIENAGHFLHHEQIEKVNNLILTWIQFK